MTFTNGPLLAPISGTLYALLIRTSVLTLLMTPPTPSQLFNHVRFCLTNGQQAVIILIFSNSGFLYTRTHYY